MSHPPEAMHERKWKYARETGLGVGAHHSKWNSFETMSLKLTEGFPTFVLFSNRLRAIFLTPTFDRAMTHTGCPQLSQYRSAQAMVVVFPVPGGPIRGFKFRYHSVQEDKGVADHERSPEAGRPQS